MNAGQGRFLQVAAGDRQFIIYSVGAAIAVMQPASVRKQKIYLHDCLYGAVREEITCGKSENLPAPS